MQKGVRTIAGKTKIRTAAELEKKIDKYFAKCKENGVVPLFPELLLELDIIPNTWDNYGREPEVDNDRYNNDSKYRAFIDNKIAMFEVIKKAELALTAAMSREATDSSKPTAAIFLLKQKVYGGYQDKQIAEISGDVPINVVIKGSSGKEFKE